MRGKLTESVKRGWLFTTEQVTGTATTDYYNGVSNTTSAIGVDTADFDDFDAILMPGTVLGEAITISNTLYAGATNNPMAASAISGASFTDIGTSNDETVREGSVKCKDQARYHFLYTEFKTSGSLPYTAHFAAMYAMGRGEKQPTSKTLDFDV